MIEALFVVLYGLAFIGGASLAWVWGRVAWRAKCAIRPAPLDQFCFIALGLCIGSFSNLIIFGLRAWVSLTRGVDPVVLATPWHWGPLLVGMTAMAISKTLLMWAHDPAHASPGWRVYAGLSALWIVGAPFLMGIF